VVLVPTAVTVEDPEVATVLTQTKSTIKDNSHRSDKKCKANRQVRHLHYVAMLRVCFGVCTKLGSIEYLVTYTPATPVWVPSDAQEKGADMKLEWACGILTSFHL
jgi:hypothetical protein